MPGETSFSTAQIYVFRSQPGHQNSALLGEKASNVEDSKKIVSTHHFKPMIAH